MDHSPLFRDLTVLFGSAVLVSSLFRAARLSTITGFIVAGTLIGPSGLGLIASAEAVRSLEEIGIILLLFSIGIEFSAERIRNMRRMALLGGGGQVLLTSGLVAAVAALAGAGPGPAILLGLIASLSSTVIGLRSLEERGQTVSPQGGVGLGILIFQDMAVLPMILLLPFLSGAAAADPLALATALGLSAAAIATILFAARALLPPLLGLTVRARSRDLFILSAVLAVTGIAWASAEFGISAGLGAFLAGLVISKSEYSHQVLSDILPFREIFNSLFFVSIGMLLEPAFLWDNAAVVGALAVAVMIGKTGLTAVAIRLLGYPWRIAVAVGLLLSQVGEFAIVLLRSGGNAALGEETGQLVLATILATMALSPLVVRLGDRFPLPASGAGDLDGPSPRSDHTLVVGYGLNGRNVVSLLAAAEMPYAILEMNPETVARARREGLPIAYGDAASPSVLEWMGVRRARAVVFAISDPAATRAAVAAARRLNANAYIIARTRYIAEIEPLYAVGASVVITEEFETSLTITRRLLDRLGVHPSRIDRTILGIRQAHYQAFRGAPPPAIEVDTAVRVFEAEA
jgi:K+:H+ antiporter